MVRCLHPWKRVEMGSAEPARTRAEKETRHTRSVKPKEEYPYQCPGEKGHVSPAVCLARQARHYDKCTGCPHREDALKHRIL